MQRLQQILQCQHLPAPAQMPTFRPQLRPSALRQSLWLPLLPQPLLLPACAARAPCELLQPIRPSGRASSAVLQTLLARQPLSPAQVPHPRPVQSAWRRTLFCLRPPARPASRGRACRGLSPRPCPAPCPWPLWRSGRLSRGTLRGIHCRPPSSPRPPSAGSCTRARPRGPRSSRAASMMGC